MLDKNFIDLLQKETEKVRLKNKPINSLHEGYGLLIEEVDELFDEVKKKRDKRDKENITLELVQIAGICQRIYEDLIGEKS